MDSVVRLTLSSSSILPRIKEALACSVVGVVVSTGVYGITVLQAYLYFRNSSQDSPRLRLFVAFLFILDTLTLVLAVDAFYKYVVTDFGNPLLLLKIPASLAFENGVAVLLRTLTQCFFAYRIWSLSKGKIVLVASIVILALCSFGPGIVVSVYLYTDDYVFSLASVKMRILTGIENGLSVVCDIVIMTSLCYYLRSRMTGFWRTDVIINRLIVYAVNRGALTALCQGGEMVTKVAFPGHFIYLPFALVGAKLYCNTLFATLNAQKSLRGEGNNVVELGSDIRSNTDSGARAPKSRQHGSTGERLASASENASTFVLDISGGKELDFEGAPWHTKQPSGVHDA